MSQLKRIAATLPLVLLLPACAQVSYRSSTGAVPGADDYAYCRAEARKQSRGIVADLYRRFRNVELDTCMAMKGFIAREP